MACVYRSGADHGQPGRLLTDHPEVGQTGHYKRVHEDLTVQMSRAPPRHDRTEGQARRLHLNVKAVVWPAVGGWVNALGRRTHCLDYSAAGNNNSFPSGSTILITSQPHQDFSLGTERSTI